MMIKKSENDEDQKEQNKDQETEASLDLRL